jgi:MerR family transcriptional regulator, heat shock protein HspR
VITPSWPDLDQGLFTISVAAELAGLHPQTLRIYEREGLLQPDRSAGGTRRYSRNDIARLQEICTLTGEGLNLAGIRRVLELQHETRQLHAEIATLKHAADCDPERNTGCSQRALGGGCFGTSGAEKSPVWRLISSRVPQVLMAERMIGSGGFESLISCRG